MTVAELIIALSTMPQDAKVIITECSRGNFDNEVRDVIYNRPGLSYAKDAHTVELDNWPKEGF